MAPQVPTAITKVMPTWQSGIGLTKYVYKKSIYCFGKFLHGTPCWDAELDATSLTWEHPSSSRACEVRHIAVSFPESVGEEEALRRLPKIAADWIRKYAPDRDWVAGIHKDNGKHHVHLVVQNVRNGKPLRLLPHQVIEMSQMGFTTEARDAKGVGTPGLHFYTKSKTPSVADTIRQATQEQLRAWWAAGHLSLGRVVKGVVTSVTWDAKKGKKPFSIRLATMERLAARAAASAGPGSDPAASLAVLRRFLTQQTKPKESDTYGHPPPHQSRRSRNLRRNRNRQGNLVKRVARVR